MQAARLHFTLATAADAHAIFDLVYRHPDPFLRAATIHDVEGWIANGACWIVRDLAGPSVVGARNIKVPETTPDRPPEPAEFSGIFIHPDYRDHGVADALGVLALRLLLLGQRSRKPGSDSAHLSRSRQKRQTAELIDRLGFTFETVIKVPDGVPGFEHMPRDKNGRLLGKEFRLPPARRIYLFREMAKLLSTDQIAGHAVHVVPALGMEPAELEKLAAALEAQQREQGQ